MDRDVTTYETVIHNENAEPEVLVEQVKQIYALAPFGILATLVNSLIVFFIMKNEMSRRTLLVWLIALIIISIIRIASVLWFRSISDRPFAARVWGNLFSAGLALIGIVWGSIVFFPLEEVSLAHQVFIAFVLGGMAAGAAATFSVLKEGYLAYSLPALVPLGIRFFLMNDIFHYAMTAMLALYGVLLWRISWHHYRANRTSLLLRFENRSMIHRLKSAKENLEEMYSKLLAEIDAKLKAEAELKAHQEHLERTVDERTTDLMEVNERLKAHIKKRKQAEQALRESKERLALAQKAGRVGVFDLDLISGKAVWTEQLEELFGLPPGGLEGDYKAWARRMHPDDRPGIEAQLLKWMRERGKQVEFEYRFIHADGRVRWMAASAQFNYLDDGTPSRMIGTTVDSTERRRAEEALRESEQFLRKVLDNLISFVAVLTPAGILLEVNRNSLEAAGLSAEDVLGMPFEETYWVSWSPEVQARMREAVRKGAEGEPSRFDMKVRMAAGALISVDFMLAPIYDEHGGISHLILSAVDITARKRMEDEIRHMAHHDTLTGLPNRRLFNEIAAVELAQAERNNKRLAVLFLDLDRFKEINDTLGHEVGDALLKEVAARIKAHLRKSDSICRIGGDEFNVILADVARAEDVSDIAKKLVDSFKKPFFISGHELHITASIGISIFPDDGDELDTLLRYSDMAMYNAKDRGRNTFQFYNPEINMRSIERMQFESRLRQTLERGELIVHYQPQVVIRTGRLIAAEALVRWRHPDLGLLESKDFVPAAESIGFITAIDEWVLRTACAQFKAWTDEGYNPIFVAVNLSARIFQNQDFVGTISRILDETGFPPQRLEIEITESTAMDDIERTIALLNELANKGISISIDDFGTGYSSLNYLKRLPIQRLKIDRSFIKDIATDPDDRAIIKAVTAMAHNMKISVVAEGVETEDQLSFLSEAECDEAQGYLLNRPLSAEQFAELIAAGK